MTWWPQPLETNATETIEANAARRNNIGSSWAGVLVAVVCGALMALALPKTNATFLAPLGAIGLFWSWFGASPKRAFLLGWAAGLAYFSIAFSWVGETAGALIAPFGFFLTLGPAFGEGFFGFALAGALVAYLNRSVRPALVPPAAAAAFAFCEWLRSEGIGVLGVPFAGLGYTQVDTPFAPLGAFAGSFGITFVLCLIAAYLAYGLRYGTRPVLRSGAAAALAVLVATAGAWTFWPARTAPPAATRVAAVQGNIAQTLKFKPEMFSLTMTRYLSLTRSVKAKHPAIVVWPETVIPAEINRLGWLHAEFRALAREIGATIIVGGFYEERGTLYNALYFFKPDARTVPVYTKRQLVPFAEHLPFAAALRWIPWARNVSDIGIGTWNGVTRAGGVVVGPIVCWESAFTDLNVDDVRAGAQVLVISTDDAWFGSTGGPYQHAQIAQMRAIETGRWIVRAAATGISGIIAPDGRYVRSEPLGVAGVVTGEVGPPVDTFYDRIGGAGIALALAATLLGIGIWGRRSSPAI